MYQFRKHNRKRFEADSFDKTGCEIDTEKEFFVETVLLHDHVSWIDDKKGTVKDYMRYTYRFPIHTLIS